MRRSVQCELVDVERTQATGSAMAISDLDHCFGAVRTRRALAWQWWEIHGDREARAAAGDRRGL